MKTQSTTPRPVDEFAGYDINNPTAGITVNAAAPAVPSVDAALTDADFLAIASGRIRREITANVASRAEFASYDINNPTGAK